MTDPSKCPECKAFHTKRVYSDFETHQVIEVRVCNDCPTEYQVTYGQPLVEVTHTE